MLSVVSRNRLELLALEEDHLLALSLLVHLVGDEAQNSSEKNATGGHGGDQGWSPGLLLGSTQHVNQRENVTIPHRNQRNLILLGRKLKQSCRHVVGSTGTHTERIKET